MCLFNIHNLLLDLTKRSISRIYVLIWTPIIRTTLSLGYPCSPSSHLHTAQRGTQSLTDKSTTSNRRTFDNSLTHPEVETPLYIQQRLTLGSFAHESDHSLPIEKSVLCLAAPKTNYWTIHISNWYLTSETVVRCTSASASDLKLGEEQDKYFVQKTSQDASIECLFEPLLDFYRTPLDLSRAIKSLVNSRPELAISSYFLDEQADLRLKKLKKVYGRRLKWKKITSFRGCNIWTTSDPNQRYLTYFRIIFRTSQALLFVHTDTNHFKVSCKGSQEFYAKAITIPFRIIFTIIEHTETLLKMRYKVIHATPQELEQLSKHQDDWWYRLMPIVGDHESDSVANNDNNAVTNESAILTTITNCLSSPSSPRPTMSTANTKNNLKIGEEKTTSTEHVEIITTKSQSRLGSHKKRKNKSKKKKKIITNALNKSDHMEDNKKSVHETHSSNTNGKSNPFEGKHNPIAVKKNNLLEVNSDFIEGDNDTSQGKDDSPDGNHGLTEGKNNPLEEINNSDDQKSSNPVDGKDRTLVVSEEQRSLCPSTDVDQDIAEFEDSSLQIASSTIEDGDKAIGDSYEDHRQPQKAQPITETTRNTPLLSTIIPDDFVSIITVRKQSLPKLDTSVSAVTEDGTTIDSDVKWDTPIFEARTDDTAITTPQQVDHNFTDQLVEDNNKRVVKPKKRKSKNKPNHHKKKNKGNESNTAPTGSQIAPALQPPAETAQLEGTKQNETSPVGNKNFASIPRRDDGGDGNDEGWSLVSRDRNSQSPLTKRPPSNRSFAGPQTTSTKPGQSHTIKQNNNNLLNSKRDQSQDASLMENPNLSNISSSNRAVNYPVSLNFCSREFPPLPSFAKSEDYGNNTSPLFADLSHSVSPKTPIAGQAKQCVNPMVVLSQAPSQITQTPSKEATILTYYSERGKTSVDAMIKEVNENSRPYSSDRRQKVKLGFYPHEETIALLLEQDKRTWRCVSPALSEYSPKITSNYLIGEGTELPRCQSAPPDVSEIIPSVQREVSSPKNSPEACSCQSQLKACPSNTQLDSVPSAAQFDSSPFSNPDQASSPPTQPAGTPAQSILENLPYCIRFGSFSSPIRLEDYSPRRSGDPKRSGPPCLMEDPLRDIPHDGKPAGFFWESMVVGFKCGLGTCETRCTSYDGRSVICPGCGPYSEVRYCCEEHLFLDAKSHWLACQRHTFLHPCVKRSVPGEWLVGPPMLPNIIVGPVTPEWHRLASRQAVDRSADYWIYADYPEWLEAGAPHDENFARVRCSTKVIRTVRFEDEFMRDHFHRVLNICIMVSVEVNDLIDHAFRMIRDRLRERGEWSCGIELALAHQMRLEFGIPPNDHNCGQRHACEPEWDGRGRRWCNDYVCRGEYKPWLGHMWSERELERVVMRYEALYWLLRAARHTHPLVGSVEARTRGEGFPNVAPQDRRIFRRGENWDGFGTGVIEIEGINDHFR